MAKKTVKITEDANGDETVTIIEPPRKVVGMDGGEPVYEDESASERIARARKIAGNPALP